MLIWLHGEKLHGNVVVVVDKEVATAIKSYQKAQVYVEEVVTSMSGRVVNRSVYRVLIQFV